MKQETIHHILFPDDKTLTNYWNLYYRGDRGRLTDSKEGSQLFLGADYYVEFNTYLNGLSYGKWKKYTGVCDISLHIELKGKGEVILCGYSLEKDVPVRKEFSRHPYDLKTRKELVLDFPKNDEMMLAFEISTEKETVFYQGSYEGAFSEERHVELSIATTTFKKEEYIRRNTRRIKEGLFERYPEVGKHIHMHVVDNGRSLVDGDIPKDDHFFVHPNPNAGGSGGFARGMIESIHQKPKATHVLLMDDDILILPESIYRTFMLLKHVKEEYKEYFISGAMMRLEAENLQHEDVGSIEDDIEYRPIKGRVMDHFLLRDNLQNEKEYVKDNMYQAWWYCCIPTSIIRRNGLPLPFFIRNDDVEFGLRSRARIISMNGICLWHMGFYGKYNVALEVYQKFRNLLISKATTGVPDNSNVLKGLKKEYKLMLIKHDYPGAEMWLTAFEDYMKGPRFIMKDRGEELLRENGKMNETMIPYDEAGDLKKLMNEDPYADIPMSSFKKWISELTYGGHLLCPNRWLEKEPVVIPILWGWVPGKLTLRKTIVVLNPFERKAAVREMDKPRFRKIMKRYIKDMLYYRKNKKKIEHAYASKRRYLTSERFWRKYLKLDM